MHPTMLQSRTVVAQKATVTTTRIVSPLMLIQSTSANDERKIFITGVALQLIVQRILRVEVSKLPPTNNPAQLGTWMHRLFQTDVDTLRLLGVETEQSFKRGIDVRYGEAGSVRTDVLLRSDDGRIIAVWDYKTGVGATIPYARIRQLQDAMSLQYGRNIPIIVLHTPIVFVAKE